MDAVATELKKYLDTYPLATQKMAAEHLRKKGFKTPDGCDPDTRYVSKVCIEQLGIRRRDRVKKSSRTNDDLTPKQRDEARALVDLIYKGTLPKRMKLRLLDVLMEE